MPEFFKTTTNNWRINNQADPGAKRFYSSEFRIKMYYAAHSDLALDRLRNKNWLITTI